jgi:hypothetical protein
MLIDNDKIGQLNTINVAFYNSGSMIARMKTISKMSAVNFANSGSMIASMPTRNKLGTASFVNTGTMNATFSSHQYHLVSDFYENQLWELYGSNLDVMFYIT